MLYSNINFNSLKKRFFKILARINRVILPSYGKKDLTRLNRFDKIIIGYRYYVTINSLDDK